MRSTKRQILVTVMAALTAAALFAAKGPPPSTGVLSAIWARDARALGRALAWGADMSSTDTFGYTPIRLAALFGDVEMVSMLMARGAVIDAAVMHEAVSYDGPLGSFVAKDPLPVLKFLLAHGGDAGARDASGATLLHVVAGYGNPQAAALLIAHGADINAVAPEGGGPQATTPLFAAIHGRRNEMVRWLLEHGADVNTVKASLNHVIPLKDIGLVKLFIARGADVNAQGEFSDTPLHLAVRQHSRELAELLIAAGANVNAVNANGRPPLSDTDDLEMIQWLLDQGADDTLASETLLHRAAASNNEALARLALARHPDVNAVNRYGDRPLHRAAGAAVAELLIAHGADVNGRNKDGYAPLHMAAGSNHLDVATVLLAHGADAGARNVHGTTPLHRTGSPEMADLLLAHDADVNARDSSGCTPLHQQHRKEMVQWLLAHGADPHARSSYGATPLHEAMFSSMTDAEVVRLLIAAGAGVDTRSDHERTPLHLVGARDDLARVLISAGADVNAADDLGRTPLHRAAQENHRHVAELLLAHGATVDARGAQGETPLHLAAASGFKSMGEFLVAHGADVRATDHQGGTPLHWLGCRCLVYPNASGMWSPATRDEEQEALLKFLMAHGADANARDSAGLTPASAVSRKGYGRMAEILRRHEAAR